MKKLIMILGVVIFVNDVSFAQSIEGVIFYEVKVNMHRRLPPDRQAMKEMMPEYNIHQDILYFNATESFYTTNDPVDESEEEDEAPGPRMVIRRPLTQIYSNIESRSMIKLQEFIGKKFLIVDSLKIFPWKLGNETKEMLGFSCKKATYFNEERQQNVTAWYTDQLAASLGPEGMSSLPGTILQLDFNDGDRVVTATRFEPRALKKGEIRIPSEGQRMTADEFRKRVDEHMKRMGGGGNIIIRN